MALKVLILRKKIEPLQGELEQLRTAAAGFEAREAELEQAINEAATDEEREVVETLVSEFEQTRETNASEQARISGEIAELERQIGEIEAAGKAARSAEPGAGIQKRSDSVADPMPNIWNYTRAMSVLGETPEQRLALLAREDVRTFVLNLRELKGTNRSVKGGELGIPDVLFGVLRNNVDRYSKLIKFITVRPIKGTSRLNVAGTVPEAIWTEAVGALNELDIVFTQLEMDGYKVGGYVAIANSTLEDDDDLELLAYVIDVLGQSIGLGVDKSIVYGTGEKMPVGFITRLAAKSQPTWWGKNQGAFTDLSASNVLKLDIGSKTSTEFFQTLILALGIASPDYAIGDPVWVMNHKTHVDLLSRCVAYNMNAAMTAGMSNIMPVLGGQIVELNFMRDNDIAGGYLSLMTYAERSGAKIESSDIPLFIQDCTVFKATQRYDGKPARGEGFVLLNYNNTAPTSSVTFGVDHANTNIGTLIVTTSAGGSGKTTVAVAGNAESSKLMYKVGGQSVTVPNGMEPDTSWAGLPSDKTVEAATGTIITVIELGSDGKAIKVGTATVTAGA